MKAVHVLVLALIPVLTGASPETPTFLAPEQPLVLEMRSGSALRLDLDPVCAQRGCLIEALQDGVDVVLELPHGEANHRFDLPNGRQGLERALAAAGEESPKWLEIQATAGSGRVKVTLTSLDAPGVSPARRRALERTCDGARANAEGRHPEAMASFAEAVRLWDAAGEPVEAALALTHLAFEHRRAASTAKGKAGKAGKGPDPLETFREAERRWSALPGQERQQARTLNEIGFVLHQRGADTEAVTELRRAVALAERAEAPGVASRAANNLGLALHALGHVAEARDAYTQALAGFDTDGDRRRAATAASNLAAALQDLGENERALELHQRALEDFRALGEPASVARVAGNRAVLLRRLGRFQEALDAYGEALELQQKYGITAAEAATLGNLGELHLLLGEVPEGRRLLERALDLHRQVGDGRGEAVTLHNLGTAARLDGGAVAAAGLYRRAAELSSARGDERSANLSRTSLGVALGQQGRVTEARAVLHEAAESAQELDDPSTAARALLSLGELELHSLDPAEAAKALSRAEPLARSLEASPILAAVLVARSKTARALGDVEAAAHFGWAAVSQVESLRLNVDDPDLRATFLAARRQAFEVAMSAEVDRSGQGAPDALEKAWELGERGRARALLDLLSKVPAALELKTPPLLTAPATAKLLGPGTLMVTYLLGEDESHLLSLDGSDLTGLTGLTDHVLPPRAEVEAAAQRLHRALATLDLGDEAGDRRLATDLSKLLLEPVADRLAAASRLVVVADGALHGLPFAALPSPRSTDGEPLLEQLEVVQVPSASVLGWQRSRPRVKVTGPAVVLADPLIDPESSWTRLPFSHLEAQAVARWAGPATRVFVGDEARPEALASQGASRAKLLHLATHAFLDAEHPERSGLILTGGVADLAMLRQLHFTADLAVLSGCSTALGKPLLGEGFVGLVQGFLDAGAQRVIASLWQVDDRSTAELFDRFYAAHLGDGLPASAALRRAQRELRRERGLFDPWHWAPFVLVGDWRP